MKEVTDNHRISNFDEIVMVKTKPSRHTAIVVGILYIIGTLSGILSHLFTRNIWENNNTLMTIAADQTPLLVGAFFILLMGFSLAAMPVFLYPYFKQKSESLALAMVIFRGPIEASTYILFVLSWLFLAAFSQESILMGIDAKIIIGLGDFFVHTNDLIASVLSLVFITGSACCTSSSISHALFHVGFRSGDCSVVHCIWLWLWSSFLVSILI